MILRRIYSQRQRDDVVSKIGSRELYSEISLLLHQVVRARGKRDDRANKRQNMDCMNVIYGGMNAKQESCASPRDCGGRYR